MSFSLRMRQTVITVLLLCVGRALAEYCYTDGIILYYCTGAEFCCGDECCGLWWVILLVVAVVLSLLGAILRICARQRTAGRVVVRRSNVPAVTTVTTSNTAPGGYGVGPSAYAQPPPYPTPAQYPQQPPQYKQ